MAAIWLIIGVVLGAALVLVALRGRLRDLNAETARRGELERTLARAESDLSHERDLATERLAAITDAQERLSSSFKALSAEALQSNMGQLAVLGQRAQLRLQARVRGAALVIELGQLRVDAPELLADRCDELVDLVTPSVELDRRRDQVDQLVAPIREQLGRVDTQLTKLDHERRSSHVRLESQLRTLSEHGERLRVETSALVTALRKPNTRGQWGQMQLRNVVEAAGMIRHCDFTEQSSYAGDEVTLRPDLIVNLPGGKHVVVDAKSPLQGLLDAYEARDDAERDAHLRDHARLLRRHVKQLGDKAYWSRLDSTPDMVVMFLPGESLLGPALDADPDLLSDAMAQRVLIATPTTLLALLHSVAYGWQQERVAESAQAISELGRELHGRLVKLSSLLASLGSKLNGTVKAYNEAIGSYEARVIPSARRFADHGAVAEGTEIRTLEEVGTRARTVQAADLRLDVGTGRPEDEVTPRRLRPAG
jgi:DNA recombination protein RmuC